MWLYAHGTVELPPYTKPVRLEAQPVTVEERIESKLAKTGEQTPQKHNQQIYFASVSFLQLRVNLRTQFVDLKTLYLIDRTGRLFRRLPLSTFIFDAKTQIR